jgi:SAM-dependent methyltransferase
MIQPDEPCSARSSAKTSDSSPLLERERTLHWLARWDRQQETFMPDREDRFAVIGDLLEICLPRPDALIVDLGIGPGSLAHRLLERFPEIRVVGVDADPLLLHLAEAAYGGPRLRTVRDDLRREGWLERLGLDRAPDAFVSTTALHWMDGESLGALFAECASAIAPGGVLLDADHLYEGASGPRLDAVLREVTARRLRRAAGVDGGDGAAAETEADAADGAAGAAAASGPAEPAGEGWSEWWEAVEADPALAGVVAERAGGFSHEVHERPTVHDYLEMLRRGGFAEAGIAWQMGDDRILLALAGGDPHDAPGGAAV